MTSTGSLLVRSQGGQLFVISEITLAALILFGPLAFGAVEPWAQAFLQILILMLGMTVVVQSARSGGMPSLDVAAIAIVVAIIGFLQTVNVHGVTSIRNGYIFSASGHYTTRLAFLWICFGVLGASASSVLSHLAARMRFAWMVFFVGAIIAFVGIVQIGQGNTSFYGLRPIKNGIPFGPYTNYNHAASLMAAAQCMGLSLFMASLVPGRRMSLGDQLARQALMLGMIALIFFGLLKTGSRGGLAGLLSGIVTLIGGWLLLARWRIHTVHRWLAIVLASAAVVGLWFNPGAHRFALSAITHGVTFRGSIYKSCLAAVLDFPAFGVGLGAVPAALHPYQNVWLGRLLESGHSDILDLVLQVGIVGTGIILFFLIRLGAKSVTACRTDDSGTAILRLGSLSACVVFLVHGIVESNLHIPANAALIFALLSFATASIGTSSCEEGSVGSLRSYAHFAAAVILAAMLAVPYRAARGAWAFYCAMNRPGSESEELLQRAVRFDARPEYEYALAMHYLIAAERTSLDRTLLRRALSASTRASEAFPYHQSYRAIHAAILSKLGRGGDAAAFPI